MAFRAQLVQSLKGLVEADSATSLNQMPQWETGQRSIMHTAVFLRLHLLSC